MNIVSVVKCDEYDEKEVREKIKKSLELLGGLKKFVKNGQKVLIKPNILSPSSPERAVTTHPLVIKAICEEVLSLQATPVIAEIPGYQHLGSGILEKTGIKKIADELNIAAVPLEKDGFVQEKIKDGKHLKSIYIAKMVKDVDVIINIPKIKTHMQAMFTGAMKNMFGCIPSSERKRAHSFGGYEKFSEVLVDIYSVLQPDLNIMDAIIGMEGTGPTQGTPKKLGLLLASSDAVALDTVAVYLIGFEPFAIAMIKEAYRRRLGEAKFENIKIVGECNISSLIVNFKRPKILFSQLPNFLTTVTYRLTELKPYIINTQCKKCFVCVDACPVSAIDKEIFKIDTSRCIECFCCHELCPNDAVGIKKSLFSNILTLIENKLRM